MNKPKSDVLVVDDDKTIRELISISLSGQFTIHEAETGEKALEMVNTLNPLVILLDINLDGGMNGKEVCVKLKENESETHPPAIIFISADDNEETILKCFEVGADDFIAKPFDLAKFVKKIEVLSVHQSLVWKLKSSEDELTSLVDTSFKQAANYGAALNLVKSMNLSDDEAELGRLVFQYLKSSGLASAIMFNSGDQQVYFDSKNTYCSPIEQQVFELTASKGRLFKFGNRMMVNDKHVSLLIKNMMPEEHADYGIFIDIIAVLIEALEARFVGLINERRIKAAQASIVELIDDVKVKVAYMQESKREMLNKIVSEVSLSFHQLELTEVQEAFFNDLLEKSLTDNDEDSKVFYDLRDKLQLAAESLQIEEREKIAKPSTSGSSDAGQDVELF
ncbi:response regulator [Flocculibacter collagenilyticus]|uniref:response regulator n=1 Tax=Flocculibacter collagenilyticus TaxID=2744479 RepID=UPI0018F4CB41|nr:response regulator [Flocculibacter collagenilyticus]